MLKTEAQAKKSYCPIVVDSPGFIARCTTTECMAWRWFDPPAKITGWKCLFCGGIHNTPHCYSNFQLAVCYEPGTPMFQAITTGDPVENRRGYCGLAGKPEQEA